MNNRNFTRTLWIIAAIGFALVTPLIVLSISNAANQPVTVIEFEFPLDQELTDSLIAKMDKPAMISGTWLDYLLFIPLYTAACISAWLLCWHYTKQWQWPDFLISFSKTMITLTVLAGVWDVFENIGILMLLHGAKHPWPYVTTAFATAKWVTILPPFFLGLLLLIPMGVLAFRKRE